MPQYRAKDTGFMFGRLYGPGTKREVVTTDEPLKPVPSWLEPIVHNTIEEEQQAEKAQKEHELERLELEQKTQQEQQKQVSQVTFVDPAIPQQHGNEPETL